MHCVTLVDRDSYERDVVLRRYVHPEILAELPDVVAVEARALQLAERLPVPTPVLLAVDATGDRSDVPALAMTLLEGRPVWETRWGLEWVSQTVDAMITLHDVDVSRGELPALTTYAQSRYDPPRWTRDPALWERAAELFHRPVPTADVGFIHRDFNPATCCGTDDDSADSSTGSGHESVRVQSIRLTVGSTYSTTARRWPTTFAPSGSNDPA